MLFNHFLIVKVYFKRLAIVTLYVFMAFISNLVIFPILYGSNRS